MDQTSTPRITCPYLNNYVGKNVMIVGKVLQLRGDMATLDADGNVTAHLNREAHLSSGNAAQIIGKVNQDLSVKVLSALDLGGDVDLNIVQNLVEISHRHKSIFIYEGQSAGGGGGGGY